jgi:hypothetical protein
MDTKARHTAISSGPRFSTIFAVMERKNNNAPRDSSQKQGGSRRKYRSTGGPTAPHRQSTSSLRGSRLTQHDRGSTARTRLGLLDPMQKERYGRAVCQAHGCTLAADPRRLRIYAPERLAVKIVSIPSPCIQTAFSSRKTPQGHRSGL